MTALILDMHVMKEITSPFRPLYGGDGNIYDEQYVADVSQQERVQVELLDNEGSCNPYNGNDYYVQQARETRFRGGFLPSWAPWASWLT